MDIKGLNHQLRDSGLICPILKTKLLFISCVPKATASFIFSYRPELLLSRSTRTSILLNPMTNSRASPYLTYEQYLTQLIYCLPVQPPSLCFRGIIISCFLLSSGAIPPVLFPGSSSHSQPLKCTSPKLRPQTSTLTS